MELDEQLPVFVSPTFVNFVIGRPDTHKCLLTVFNPYQFAIRFKFLTNAPQKYRVENTFGGIRPNNYIDTIIRLRNPSDIGEASNDCLRIEIYRENEQRPVGQKDIPLVVLASDANHKEDSECLVEFTESPSTSMTTNTRLRSKSIRNYSISTNQQHQEPHSPQTFGFYWLAIVSLFVCLLCLLLPPASNPDNSENNRLQRTHGWIPFWFRPTHTSQCVASYVLGLLTMYFFLQPIV